MIAQNAEAHMQQENGCYIGWMDGPFSSQGRMLTGERRVCYGSKTQVKCFNTYFRTPVSGDDLALAENQQLLR